MTHPQVATSRRFKWRTLVFWLIVLTIAGIHGYASVKLFSVQQEIREFESIHGVAAHNDSRLSVTNIPLDEPYRWRFYAEKPMGRKFRICAITEEIDRWPRKDTMSWTDAQPYSWRSDREGAIEHDSFTINLNVKRGDGETFVQGRAGMPMMSFRVPSDHPLHHRDLKDLVVESVPSRGRHDEDTPRLLLRITDPQTPGRGLVIWIENRFADPRTGL